MLNWIFWLTGAAVWGYVAYRTADRLIRALIFAYRMGWRRSRSFYVSSWIDMIIDPPDAVGDRYWPSKSGADMRRRDDAQRARDFALLDSDVD